MSSKPTSPTSRLTMSAPSDTAIVSPPQVPPKIIPHSNPKVAELQAMFPTIEVDVIEVILESCGGSSDRAIETLLQMTDPEFKPEPVAARSEQDSQLDLDAQFARSLQMQEQQSYRNPTQSTAPVGSGQLPYQPRVRRYQPPVASQQRGDPFSYQSQPQGQGQTRGQYDQYQNQHQGQGYEEGSNPPGMLAVEEKLERFAEVGKQTFNSLLSKAKAKYSEYQAQQAQGQVTSANESNWGREASHPSSHYQPQGQGGSRPVYMQGGGRGGEQNRGGGGGLWSEPKPHTPSTRSESFSSQSTTDPTPVPQPALRQSTNRWQPSDAYDDPLPPTRTLSQPSGRRSPGSAGVGSPEKTTGKIDLAKLGILPKKRVDLLSTSPQAPTSLPSLHSSSTTSPTAHTLNPPSGFDDTDPNPSLPTGVVPKSLVEKIPKTPPRENVHTLGESDDDDDLEYTKNPFNE